MCMHVCVCGCPCITGHVQRSEYILQMISSLNTEDPRIELRSLGLAASTFNYLDKAIFLLKITLS